MGVRRRWSFPMMMGAAVVAASGLVLARPQAPLAGQSAPATLSQKLPVDPDVTTGTYANGLRYYLRTNPLPAKRAELRLVVRVGSLMEEDDQQGLAHFVEHMAFNGTKNFPKSDIVKFMESIGMRFGPSVNAFTSFDETVYMLQVPTDTPQTLDRSLLILEDWAHGVSFDDTEIDKERGVIMEEWRLRRGAAARLQDQQFPILLKGSRYAERLPIGKTDVIQNFKHDRLRKFYADWYRPDLMAVVAVGDFDLAAVKGLIDKHFGALPKRATARPRPAYDVPKQPGTLFAIATDPEAPMTTVQVYSKMAFRDPSTVGAYRQQIVERLFGAMLNDRFTELSQKPEAPFLGAGAGRGLFVKSAEASTLTALPKEGASDRALKTLLVEVERVARFGFTSTEFEREKADLLRGLEQTLAEKDKRPSARLADEYVRNVTQDEPFPGLSNEVALTRQVLPSITLAEVNSLAREWAPDGNRVIVVSAPQKPGVSVPTEAELRAAIAAAASEPVQPYVEAAPTAPFFNATPVPGTVVKVNVRSDVGITEWELSNGVNVVLKPTTFKEDEILFRAFSPGGTSLVPDADYVWADSTASIVASGGLGALSRLELRKQLTGKLASVSPYISTLDEGVNGTASKKDLETMFQLVYLTFTQPRADRQVFEVAKTTTKTLLTNMRSQPQFLLSEALNDAISQGHPRSRTPTAQDLDRMDLDRSMAFYRDRFADASDFTFVFVGSFDVDAMKPLVERYLASLPALHRHETWKDIGMRTPAGIVERRVEKGLEPQSQSRLVFSGPFQYNQTQRIAIRAVASVLQTRLRETLREDLGGTYSVTASAAYDKFPQQEFKMTVAFGSSPDRADELMKRVFEVVDQLRTVGPTDKDVNDAIEGFVRDYETNLKTNNYLLTQLGLKYQYGESDELPMFFNLVPEYRKLTAASIRDAAKMYLDPNRYVKVVLMPEKK